MTRLHISQYVRHFKGGEEIVLAEDMERGYFHLLINRAGKTSWLQHSKCLELWMQMTKIYLVKIIAGFLHVWNLFKEPLMQNFVFFWVRRMIWPEILAQIFIFIPQLWWWWLNLWHRNRSALVLVIMSQTKQCDNESKKTAS